MPPSEEQASLGALGGAAPPEQGRAPPNGTRAMAPPGFGALPSSMSAAQAAGAPAGGAPAGLRPPPPGFAAPHLAAAAGRPGAAAFGGAAAGNGAAQDAGAWVRHTGRLAELAGGLSGRSSRAESPAAGLAAGGSLFSGICAPPSGYPSFASDAALSTDGGGSAARPLTRAPSAAALGAGLAQRSNPGPGWGLPGAAHADIPPPSVLPQDSQLLGGRGGLLGAGSYNHGAREGEGVGPGGSFSSLFGRDMFAAQRVAPAPASLSSAFTSATAPGLGGLAPQLGAQAQRGGLGSYSAAGAQAGGGIAISGRHSRGPRGQRGLPGIRRGVGPRVIGRASGASAHSCLTAGHQQRAQALWHPCICRTPAGGPAARGAAERGSAGRRAAACARQAGCAGLRMGRGCWCRFWSGVWPGPVVRAAAGARAWEHGSARRPRVQADGQLRAGQRPGRAQRPVGAPMRSSRPRPQLLARSMRPSTCRAPMRSRKPARPPPRAAILRQGRSPICSAPMRSRRPARQRPQAPSLRLAGLPASMGKQVAGGGNAYGAQHGSAVLDALGQMRQPPPGISAHSAPYASANPAAWGNLASLGSQHGRRGKLARMPAQRQQALTLVPQDRMWAAQASPRRQRSTRRSKQPHRCPTPTWTG